MIFLDVDGPLVDTVGTLAAHFGRDSSLEWWPAGEYELTKVFECTEADLWMHTDHDWWASLPMTPWAHELIELCARWPGGFTLATSPLSCDTYSASGKLAWIQKTFGAGFRDYFIGPPKAVLGRVPGAILIDDFGVTCSAFAAAGGSDILFPRRWNSRHAQHDNPMDVVKHDLELMRHGRGRNFGA